MKEIYKLSGKYNLIGIKTNEGKMIPRITYEYKCLKIIPKILSKEI